ncbi:MAG: mechanosensitive ion channel family protein [Nitrososphaeria archaeon]
MSSRISYFKIYAIFIALAFILAIIYVVTSVVPIIPLKYSKVINAAVVAVVLYLALRIFLPIFDRAFKIEDPEVKATTKFVISLVWYGIIGLAVAASFGVDVSSIILGSAFASVIIGLAAQTVLSNVLAGLALLVSKPVKIGERVTIATWQFGSVFPTYPPKFFSQDILINGFTGSIIEIKLMYTFISDDEGATLAIPNNIILSSSMFRTYKERIITTVRFPVKNIDVGTAKERAKSAVEKCPMVIESKIFIDEVYQDSYILKISALCKGNRQDVCRSEILEYMLREFSDKNQLKS